jgi:hypothetical protein
LKHAYKRLPEELVEKYGLDALKLFNQQIDQIQNKMANIFTRSPHIVEINVAGQVETKIELYLWNSGSMPSAPQYILSKLIPATNAPATYYDLSPYVSEFIDHNNLQTQPDINGSYSDKSVC